MNSQNTTKAINIDDHASETRAGDVRSVARAISVLSAFEDAEELSLAELAAHTQLPKLSLGPRLVSVARLVLTRGLPATARPHMQALARTFGHTVNLAVLDGDEMLFIDVIESRSNLRMVSGIGAREPFNAAAVGKAVVAELEPGELEAELKEIRARGYATDRGGSQPGARRAA